MSQYNLRFVPTLSCNQFLLNGQNFSTQAALIGNVNTSALTTEVIINDDTKNQVLFQEIYGNIHGNTFPQLQAEVDALEANVAILQGEVLVLQNEMTVVQGNIIALEVEDINLQNQILLLSGNVVINANAIAELISDTQFLEAPYNGLAGNTSFFWRGLQVYNTPTDVIDETNGTGIFSYLDGGAPGSQIQLRVQDTKNILLAGGSQLLKPKSTGNVSVNNTDGNFSFLVGDRTTANFQTLSKTTINGAIDLKGEGNTAIAIYTEPAQTIPLPIPAIKRCDMRGDDETRLFGKLITATDDDGGKITLSKSVSIFTPGGSSPGQIDLQVGSCDLNTTGRINIGTTQGLTEAGFKEIYIGQNGPPSAARKSSTLLDGDTYLPQNLVLSPNAGGWDNLVYLGLPTAYSGPLRGPVKNTYSPYVRSISTFSAAPTINSFIQSSGTFTVAVGLGAITLNAGAGGCLMNCAGGLIGLTSLIGGIGLTTAGGGIALTTGAGIIQMTTGAAPIAMETNVGDILLKAGYSNQSTPELSLGSVYIQARDYNYITPDKGVIVGEGIVTPFNDTLLDTMGYPFTGNLFANTLVGNLTGVFSNTFITPNSTTTLLNPVNSNLIYSNAIYETGSAFALLRNMDINGTIATSSSATVPSGNLGANVAITNTTTNFYFPDNTVLPLNANVKLFVYVNDTPNIANYKYSTWQANAQIQSNISGLVNAYVEPLPPSYENYMTVLGNVGILSDLDVGANITVASSSFPAQQTLITRNSVTTTGNITCNTLNYTTLNPPIVLPNIAPGVDSIIAGTNVSISPLNGIGNVVINCTLPNIAGVNSIIAGNGIQISPIGGQGNVTVSLAGSVIPPGGYLPISGGIMTGEIHQYPSTGNLQDNTVKLYRPQTSYQPPYPSIGPPSFTGELLTFFNGDNPGPTNFTGWFPQNTFTYQPDVITDAILTTGATFYQSTGGAGYVVSYIMTQLPQFQKGDHITGGSMYASTWVSIQGQLLSILTSDNIAGPYETLYSTNPLGPSPPYPTTWNLPIDYTYTGGQKAYNFFQLEIFPGYETPCYIGIIANSYMLEGVQFYNWQGQLNIPGFTTPTHFIGVQGDLTTSVLYEYFPDTGINNKLLSVNKSGGVGKIHGIYSGDTVTTRELIIYGDFYDIVQQLPNGQITTYVANNIFQYNIDTLIISLLTTQTMDPAYSGNLPKGVNGAVYGVEKQVSAVLSRNVWIWGDFTGVAQMGNPNQPNDCTLQGGCSSTLSDNWGVAISWNFNYSAGQGPFNCRGGRIINNTTGSDFLLMVYAGGLATNTTYNSLTIIYYNPAIAPGFLASFFPFANGSITSSFSNAVDYITIVDTSIIMTGEFTGTAQGVSLTDIPIYSIMRAPIGTFSIASGLYSSTLFEMANSGNATFWVEGTNQIGVSRIKLLNDSSTLVLGTYGYGTSNNGGGVLTFPFPDVSFVDTPAVKYNITGIPPYTVLNIANDVPTDVLLSCSLDQDNFWYGQTFNSTLVPDPSNQPVVNAINGAKFLVDNQEMTKIVFSANVQQNYASVSFIAGSAPNDKNWYWYSQVGAIDYYAGNVFYPNVTSSPGVIPTSSTLGQVMINGSIASTALDMNDFNIINANTIFSANILTLNPINGVEVGVGGRREELVAVEVFNNGALTGQNNFDAVTGIIQGGGFSNPTNNIYVTTINATSGYDDGMSGNSTITIALIEDDSGTETVLGSQNISTGSGLSTYTVTFSPAITINPSATKTYFVRMSVPPQSPMYSYYGTISDGLTPAIIVTANTLQQVSDPIEYFNVYGNSFFQDNMLVHANVVVADPTNTFFYTQIEHNYIQLQGETINTQLAPGQTFINSGVNQTRQEATYLQIKRNDITRQATLNNGSLAFIEGTSRTATYSPFTCDINSTSAPIARATMQVGALTLNNNSAGGSVITLNKDAISVATDEISSITSATKDANGTSRIFTKISSRASAVGTGNQDGTLAILTLINGTLLEVFNFSGNDNEINSFRPLDMNGNFIRTTQGNLVCTASSSTGVGNLTLQSKANAIINIDSGPSGRINLSTLTGTATTAHNVTFHSTSNGVIGQNYLKMQLNGVDIWVPYLTTDPTI
tara:strand:- start:3798 stop:10073 length:6276 start_codon:yes stop_codon:yes gene_type:complete